MFYLACVFCYEQETAYEMRISDWSSDVGSSDLAAERNIRDDGMAAADLVGHLNLIHPSRIQVFGQEELAYYSRFDLRRHTHHMDELLIGGVPAILLAEIGRASGRGRGWYDG